MFPCGCLTAELSSDRAAPSEVERKTTGRLRNASIGSYSYTRLERAYTHPPDAAPSRLMNVDVRFDHGCSK